VEVKAKCEVTAVSVRECSFLLIVSACLLLQRCEIKFLVRRSQLSASFASMRALAQPLRRALSPRPTQDLVFSHAVERRAPQKARATHCVFRRRDRLCGRAGCHHSAIALGACELCSSVGVDAAMVKLNSRSVHPSEYSHQSMKLSRLSMGPRNGTTRPRTATASETTEFEILCDSDGTIVFGWASRSVLYTRFEGGLSAQSGHAYASRLGDTASESSADGAT
jgi:hypothetical protein